MVFVKLPGPANKEACLAPKSQGTAGVSVVSSAFRLTRNGQVTSLLH